VRPSKTVASAVLSAVLALAALPGLAGSRSLSPDQAIDAAAFQAVEPGGWPLRAAAAGGPLDPAQRADGFIDGETYFEEPGQPQAVPRKATVKVPASKSTWGWKEPRYTLSGDATYYSAGYTAMRLPRGTVVVICGKAACIERVVNDYGPITESRIVDLYKPDFFEICGCASWEGIVPVTVRVY
jgi:hypothetical protein